VISFDHRVCSPASCIVEKHWNGKIGFVSGILSTMTDLEILLLEKFAAKKLGIII
jgi:hypothetical protein